MNKKKTLRNLDWVEANYTCMVKLQACGSTAALPKCEKELFASLREVYYSLLPEERRTPRAKQARKYQREAAVMLAKRGQLSGRVLLRTLLCPDGILSRFMRRCRTLLLFKLWRLRRERYARVRVVQRVIRSAWAVRQKRRIIAATVAA